jgi:hypothetical protein
MSLSKNRFSHQINFCEQSIGLKFLFVKGPTYKLAWAELCAPLGSKLTHFGKWSDGSIVSRRVIFHGRTITGQRGNLNNFRRNSRAVLPSIPSPLLSNWQSDSVPLCPQSPEYSQCISDSENSQGHGQLMFWPTIRNSPGATSPRDFWMCWEMMNLQNLQKSPDQKNLRSHVITNPLTVMWNLVRPCPQEQKQELLRKRPWSPLLSPEQSFYPSTSFLAKRNRIRIISSSFWYENYPGETRTRDAWLAITCCLCPWTAECVTCKQQSGVFRPKGNEERFLSRLFSETLTVWCLVLRVRKRANEKSSTHGRGRPGSKLPEVREDVNWNRFNSCSTSQKYNSNA